MQPLTLETLAQVVILAPRAAPTGILEIGLFLPFEQYPNGNDATVNTYPFSPCERTWQGVPGSIQTMHFVARVLEAITGGKFKGEPNSTVLIREDYLTHHGIAYCRDLLRSQGILVSVEFVK